jgi:vancomycin resistance protein YoaR
VTFLINVIRKLTLFIILFAQTVLAVAGGLAGVYLVSGGRMPPGLYIGDVPVQGLTKQEALSKIEKRYSGILSKGSVIIKFNDGKQFVINYDDIDAAIDYENTVNAASNEFSGMLAVNLINSIAGSKKSIVYPVFNVNEFKLKTKLKELSSHIVIEPKNADIFIQNGRIVKTPEIPGIKLNIDNAASKIVSRMGEHMDTPIVFDDTNGSEVETVYPQITLADLEGADEIISEYSTLLKSSESEYSAKIAAYAVNKVVVLPDDPGKGLKAGTFSFNKYLGQINGTVEKDDEGYNQVASTLYAAVLGAGIDLSSITRVLHKTPADYIKPGLDACVGTSDKDFRFINTLNNRLVVFAVVADGRVTVSIAGTKADKDIKISTRSEIVQKYSPSVISVENQDLKQGESRIISNGSPGIKVKTFRQVIRNKAVEKEELVSTDMYDPVDAIVQLGPNTKWDGDK